MGILEAAQALAARILKEARGTKERVDYAFRLCYARPPSGKESDLLMSYLARRRQLAANNPKSADAMPMGDLPDVDPSDAIAWFGASRALINSDEFLTRE
jgi:hypothetical protein